MARLFFTLVFLTSWSNCFGLWTSTPCRNIERVYYWTTPSKVLPNVFLHNTKARALGKANYMVRWTCCDDEGHPDYCGTSFCSAECIDNEGQCSYDERTCKQDQIIKPNIGGLFAFDDSQKVIPDTGSGEIYNFEPSLNPIIDGRPDGICSICCGGSIRTFDSLTFNYPLHCRYVMAYFHAENEFTVDIIPYYECNTETGLCKSAVNITNTVMMLEFKPSGVFYNNRIVDLPFSTLTGVWVYKRGIYTVFQGADDTHVYFDGDNGVAISIGEIYKASKSAGQEYTLQGLCGNYDSNPSNDIDIYDTPKYIEQFRVPERQCLVPNEQHVNPFDSLKPDVQKEVMDMCNQFKMSPAFKTCRSKVLVDPFYNSCWFSMSSCKLEGRYCDLCSIYAQYSVACSLLQVSVEWRTKDFCYKKCDPGMVYKECGSACPRTCENLLYPEECNEDCFSGCQCRDGTFFDGVTCVPSESCPCLRAGEYYPSGARIKDGCRNCICLEGILNKCTSSDCPGTCSVLAGHCFRTFDGTCYNHRGQCEYVLVQNKKNSLDSKIHFSIFMDRSHCKDKSQTCVPQLGITIPDETQIRIEMPVGLIHVKEAGKPMQEMQIPYIREAGLNTIIISKVSSLFVRIALPEIGITLFLGLDNRIYITVNEKLKNKIHGLCGDFDGDQNDDFSIPTDGSMAAVLGDFIPKWSSNAQCKEPDSSTTAPDLCTMEPHLHQAAIKICDQLWSDPFKECNSLVDATKYHKLCIKDRCSDFEEAECLAFAAYAFQCSKSGIVLDWRTEQRCPVTCKPGQVYKECGFICRAFCSDLGTFKSCQEQCIPGCQCRGGQVYSYKYDKCVVESDCECRSGGIVYSPGERWSTKCEDCYCESGIATCKNTCGGIMAVLMEAPTCTGGQQYIQCIECIRTCENIHLSCSQTTCTEGCGCPPGTVDKGDGTCISPTQCPCYYKGRTYQHDEDFQDDCHTCTCFYGQAVCPPGPCPATCRAYGDPHYITFDGRKYEFQGECSYVLTTNQCGLETDSTVSFRVVVENVPCGVAQVTCTKSIVFTIIDVKISLVRGATPVVEPPETVPTKAVYKFTYSGIYFIVNTNHGITLIWDFGTSLHVTLEAWLRGQVCGLCGDFDGDAENDFRTRSGEITATANLFGHSWKTVPSCSLPPTPVHPCEIHPERKGWAEFSCGIIKKSVFSNCHDLVDPEPFFDDCIFDTCGCDRGGDCDCLCTVISNYAAMCNTAGVPVKWRSDQECGLQCENGMTYQPCGKVCPDVCYVDKFAQSTNCELTCVEGCHCPEGKKLLHGECVTNVKCPCKYQDQIVQPGEIINCCECVDGAMVCDSENCVMTTPEPTTQPPLECPDGQVEVDCNGDCRKQSCDPALCHPSKVKSVNGQVLCCECAEGTLYDGETCVEECSCLDEMGQFREPNEEWESFVRPCAKCKCHKNNVTCYEDLTMPGCEPTTSEPIKSTPPPPSPVCPKGQMVSDCSKADCRQRVCQDDSCYYNKVESTISDLTWCCECLPDTYYDGSKCVQLAQCYCIDAEGTKRQPDEKWEHTEPCEMCTCENGKVTCERDEKIPGCGPGEVCPKIERCVCKGNCLGRFEDPECPSVLPQRCRNQCCKADNYNTKACYLDCPKGTFLRGLFYCLKKPADCEPETTVAPTTTEPEPECPAGQVPTDCSKVCRTEACKNQCYFTTIYDWPGTTKPCCECAEGTVYNGQECVAPSECPCRDETGTDRAPNEKWSVLRLCEICICKDNSIECSPDTTSPGCRPTTPAPPTTPASTTVPAPTMPPKDECPVGQEEIACSNDCRERSCKDGLCYIPKVHTSIGSSGPLCCECKKGTAWNGNECVAPSKCQCRDELGQVREPYEVWDSRRKCYKCTCKDNEITCEQDTTSSKCRKPCDSKCVCKMNCDGTPVDASCPGNIPDYCPPCPTCPTDTTKNKDKGFCAKFPAPESCVTTPVPSTTIPIATTPGYCLDSLSSYGLDLEAGGSRKTSPPLGKKETTYINQEDPWRPGGSGAEVTVLFRRQVRIRAVKLQASKKGDGDYRLQATFYQEDPVTGKNTKVVHDVAATLTKEATHNYLFPGYVENVVRIVLEVVSISKKQARLRFEFLGCPEEIPTKPPVTLPPISTRAPCDSKCVCKMNCYGSAEDPNCPGNIPHYCTKCPACPEGTVRDQDQWYCAKFPLPETCVTTPAPSTTKPVPIVTTPAYCLDSLSSYGLDLESDGSRKTSPPLGKKQTTYIDQEDPWRPGGSGAEVTVLFRRQVRIRAVKLQASKKGDGDYRLQATFYQEDPVTGKNTKVVHDVAATLTKEATHNYLFPGYVENVVRIVLEVVSISKKQARLRFEFLGCPEEIPTKAPTTLSPTTTLKSTTVTNGFCVIDLDNEPPPDNWWEDLFFPKATRRMSEAPDVTLQPDDLWVPENTILPEDEETVYDRPHMIVDFKNKAKITAVRVDAKNGKTEPVIMAFKYKGTGSSAETEVMVDGTRLIDAHAGDTITLPDTPSDVTQLQVFLLPQAEESTGYTLKFYGCGVPESTEPPPEPATTLPPPPPTPPKRCEEGDVRAYNPPIIRYSEQPDKPLQPGEPVVPHIQPKPEGERDVFYRTHYILDFKEPVRIIAVKILASDGSKVRITAAFSYKTTPDSQEVYMMDDFDETYLFNSKTGKKINLNFNMPPISQLNVFIIPAYGYGVSEDLGYIVEEYQECTLPVTTLEPESTTPGPDCIENGVEYKEGDVVLSKQCSTIFCGKGNSRIQEDFVCDKTCPSGVLAETVDPDTCCPVCVPKEECHYNSYWNLLVIEDCVSEQEIEFTDCEGNCASNTHITLPPKSQIQFNCGCCKPSELHEYSVNMNCNNGTTFSYEYYGIRACSCLDCSYDPISNLIKGTTEIR